MAACAGDGSVVKPSAPQCRGRLIRAGSKTTFKPSDERGEIGILQIWLVSQNNSSVLSDPFRRPLRTIRGSILGGVDSRSSATDAR